MLGSAASAVSMKFWIEVLGLRLKVLFVQTTDDAHVDHDPTPSEETRLLFPPSEKMQAFQSVFPDM